MTPVDVIATIFIIWNSFSNIKHHNVPKVSSIKGLCPLITNLTNLITNHNDYEKFMLEFICSKLTSFNHNKYGKYKIVNSSINQIVNYRSFITIITKVFLNEWHLHKGNQIVYVSDWVHLSSNRHIQIVNSSKVCTYSHATRSSW